MFSEKEVREKLEKIVKEKHNGAALKNFQASLECMFSAAQHNSPENVKS